MRQRKQKLTQISIYFCGVVFGLISMVLIKPINAQDADFFQIGEDLTYEVSWWFIKIGTIRTKMLSSENVDNTTR